MPGRLDSRPLRVSQRSNALQFYHHSLPSFSDRHNPTSQPYYLYADPPLYSESPARRQYAQQSPSGNPAPPRHRKISSLVTPFLTTQSGKGSRSGSLKKQGGPVNGVGGDRARLTSSSASTRSMSSSVRSRKRKYSTPPTLDTLPSELLCEIFCYLNQETLHALLFVSRRVKEEAVYSLYEQPRFASTYRFAQFVTTVTHSRHLAGMVREMDVSNLAEMEEDEGINGGDGMPGAIVGKGERRPLAGWREWKFRNDPLHTIFRDDYVAGSSKRVSGAIKRRLKHPLPSPFLQRYNDQRDLPIGAVVHVIVACPFLRKIDLSDIPLSDDYSVTPLGSHRTPYKPTTFTNLLFVSDVPKSYTWKDGDTQQISATSDLIDAITTLRFLKEIRLRRGLWLTTAAADRLVRGVKKLERVDFRECGMYRGQGWAVEGEREVVKRLLDVEKRAEEERARR